MNRNRIVPFLRARRGAPSRLPSSLLLSITAALLAGSAGAQERMNHAQMPLIGDDPHVPLFSADEMPSARECAACHETIFNEWRSSAHAYSAISPMFHKFEQALNTLASGTVSAFCVRCHISVGTTLGEPRHAAIWERAEVSMEGVTCITCHRVRESYGRVNGSRRIESGSIFEPVYGTVEDSKLQEVIDRKGDYGVAVEPGTEATEIHKEAVANENLAKSEFCVSCHQVAVHPGIKLEVVWDQYLDSPAHDKGISCQDCHMGAVPGTATGDPATNFKKDYRAIVNTSPVGEKVKHTDHSFVGPGYSIAHPGIFPHRVERSEITYKEWMSFDWTSDWGRADFEGGSGPSEVDFPDAWKDADRRRSARAIVDENLATLAERKERRRQIMEKGSHIDGPFFTSNLAAGRKLSFYYDVTNTCEGHNFPSGSLGAQPQIWLNVALIDPTGTNVWESGYTDSIGDVADNHSQDVLDGKIPWDAQLFNLQTKFLTTNLKGTDREMYLPVPFDADQLPYIRPAGVPSTVLNHPPFIRMEQRSIPPLTTRRASYSVPAEKMQMPGKYRLAVRLRSRAEPIYFMKFVGSTEEMKRLMNERMVDIHPYTVEFEVK